MGVTGAMSYACGPLLNYSGFANAPSFQYAYNADGTIASEGEVNDIPRYYYYDKLGQLTFVSDGDNDLCYDLMLDRLLRPEIQTSGWAYESLMSNIEKRSQ